MLRGHLVMHDIGNNSIRNNLYKYRYFASKIAIAIVLACTILLGIELLFTVEVIDL